MSDKKPTLMDWLGLNIQPDYSKARWLGGLVSVAFIALIALLALPALYQFFKAVTGFGDFGGLAKQHEAIRNSGLVVAALVGVPFVIWRSAVAQKQVNVAEQGHITDRINKAVEGLGAQKTMRQMIDKPRFQRDRGGWKLDDNGEPIPALRPDGTPLIDRESLEYTEPNIEVRIGAIYALERIAAEDLSFHIQIMEILCAYIRHNAPASLASDDPENLTNPRDDIQTALTVLGRRSENQIVVERAVITPDDMGHRLDLRATFLQAVDLSNLNFELANFGDANLQGANLWDASLQGANLGGANLQGTNLAGANLQEATVWDAELQGANLEGAKIDDTTSLNPATLRGAGLREVDFTSITNPALLAEAFGDASVTLPDGYVAGQGGLAHWSSEDLGRIEFQSQWHSHQKPIGYEP